MDQEAFSATAHNAVVIGATGNLGRHICAALTAADHNVIGVARSVADGVAASRIVPLDVASTDPPELRRVLSAHDPSVVVNVSGGWETTEQEMHAAHVQLVEHLVAAAAGLERRPRLVHVGTIHEYGPVPARTSIDEQRVPEPTTAYARTKLAGSRAVLDATAAGEIDGTVLRVVNVCGPGTQPASFLGSLAARLCATEPGVPIELTITDAKRDYVDVRDVADAVVRAATAVPEVVGAVINIGRGEAVSMRTLVTALVEAARLDPRDIVEIPAQVTSKGGDWTQADISRSRALLGWAPTTSLRTSMADMCARIRTTTGT
ncbi:NAD(P)-dependent oxidoreductase [Nocardiopsis gilva YIM 90087]|uniref:NAD(P)-dependent oxidoreductase n=1 Tax=Nocardiopsis gilva YIM 90087 TaxID=1235441 RepID=A0A223S188_9ACTN|nr:NAD(P)-dependent oxidoreductase [Nocardiopsis gilva]ASU81857.1 NAD(P)-dependent oxidoreductase [Nocardiopsis gilva YIM 90087]